MRPTLDRSPEDPPLPTGLPDSAELHRRHLATALAQHGTALPAVPFPDEFVEQCVVGHGAVSQGNARRTYGRVSWDSFLKKRPEMGRARDHCPGHEIWGLTDGWLAERNAYLSGLRALADDLWRRVFIELERDRTTGSFRPPKTGFPELDTMAEKEWTDPKLPSDLFVVPVLLAIHGTLVTLGVDRRGIPAAPLRIAVDRTHGDGGYLKREPYQPLFSAPPRAPRPDLEFVRDQLPWALSNWSRRAGELQESFRLELAGAPRVMDICRRYAKLVRTRSVLVARFAALAPDDLREGSCEQCQPDRPAPTL